MSDAFPLGVLDSARAVAQGEVTAERLAQTHLERIEASDGDIRAFLHHDPERVLERAREVDALRSRGADLPPFAGVHIAVKDNLCTADSPTTCASRILEGYLPPYDAHVVERLRAAGATIIGKTNLDEFAMGSSTENSAYATTCNPWDLERAPGGSSGGSAAAVSAGMSAGALGSDTGGSVRQPAAFCGISALKPTYGSVSRYGLVAFASSLDQVGAMAYSVADVAALHDSIAGFDPRDATSLNREATSCLAAATAPAEGIRVGVWSGWLLEQIDDDARAAVQASRLALEDAGATAVDIDLPHASLGVSVYYVLAAAEASSNLARFDGMRYGARASGKGLVATYEATRGEGLGPEVKRRILLGTHALSSGYYDALYNRAQRARGAIRSDFANAFASCDAILSPTTPSAAFRLKEKSASPLSMYLADICTLPASLAGLPAISTPASLSGDGLPMGVQLVGQFHREDTLVTLASAIEARCAIGHPGGETR